MKIHATVALSAIAVSLLAACANTPPAWPASAELIATSGSSVNGMVYFAEVPGGVRIAAKVTGLKPGEHGFHIHEQGDCSALDGSSAKGHFNPSNKDHGHHSSEERHGGDMPNMVANEQGEASYSGELKGVTFNGPTGILGRGIVIHADPDDYKSQPAGNSGRRMACGVIAEQR